MKDQLRALSSGTEFFIVITLSFGYFILSSLLSVTIMQQRATISDSHLRSLLIYEPVMLFVVCWFLNLRNWKLSEFNLKPSIRATGQGVLIALGVYVTYSIILLTAAALSETIRNIAESSRGLVSGDLSLTNIIAVSMINSVFEEFLVVGYVLLRFQNKQNEWFAINVSVAIRLLYHLYQGPIAVFSIIPIGLIFAYWYAKTKKLWPIIVAHAVIDFVGLYAYRNIA